MADLSTAWQTGAQSERRQCNIDALDEIAARHEAVEAQIDLKEAAKDSWYRCDPQRAAYQPKRAVLSIKAKPNAKSTLQIADDFVYKLNGQPLNYLKSVDLKFRQGEAVEATIVFAGEVELDEIASSVLARQQTPEEVEAEQAAAAEQVRLQNERAERYRLDRLRLRQLFDRQVETGPQPVQVDDSDLEANDAGSGI